MPVQLTEAGHRSPFLQGVPEEFLCLQWHGAEVTRMPEGAQVLVVLSRVRRERTLVWRPRLSRCSFTSSSPRPPSPTGARSPSMPRRWRSALGEGALPRLDAKAAANMPAFASLSRTLYRNFMGTVGKA